MDSNSTNSYSEDTVRTCKSNIKQLKKQLDQKLKFYKNVTNKTRQVYGAYLNAEEACDKKSSKKNRIKFIEKTGELENQKEIFATANCEVSDLMRELKEECKKCLKIIGDKNRNYIKEKVNFEDFMEKIQSVIDSYDYDLIGLIKEENEAEEEKMSANVENANREKAEEKPVQSQQENVAFVPAYQNNASDVIRPSFSTLNIAPITLDVSQIVKSAVESSVSKMSALLDKKIEDYINGLNLKQPSVPTTEETHENIDSKSIDKICEIGDKEAEIYSKLQVMLNSLIELSKDVDSTTLTNMDLKDGYANIMEEQKNLIESQKQFTRDLQGLQVKYKLVSDVQSGLVEGQSALFEKQKELNALIKKATEGCKAIEDDINAVNNLQKEIAERQKELTSSVKKTEIKKQ